MDDVTQIIQNLNIYALGVDTQRWELFDLVFAQDCEVNSPPGLHWTDLKSFKADFDFIHRPLEQTMHRMTNHIVFVNGDSADSVCYGRQRLMRHTNLGGDDFWEGAGWYEDHHIRTKDGWRIKKRTIYVSWWEGNPLMLPPMPTHSPGWKEGMDQDRATLYGYGQKGRVPVVEKLLCKR